MNHILDGNENDMTTGEKAKVILDILFGHDDLIFFYVLLIGKNLIKLLLGGTCLASGKPFCKNE